VLLPLTGSDHADPEVLENIRTGRPVSAAALGLPSLVRSSAAVGAPIPPVSATDSASISASRTVPDAVSHPHFVPVSNEPSLPPRAPAPVESTPEAVVPLDEMEKCAILAALKSTGGNRTRAAELLNISIRTLRNKLQEYRASGDFNDALA